jgi:hypothetical protein
MTLRFTEMRCTSSAGPIGYEIEPQGRASSECEDLVRHRRTTGSDLPL